jgi:thioredoxin reductase
MTDALLRWMKSRDVPITRDAYIQLAWGNDPPDPWTPEHEAELPEELQSTDVEDQFDLFDYDPSEPRDPAGRWTTGGGGGESGGGKYGLVPGDVEKFHALKSQWSKINNDLLEHVDNPDGPESRAALDKLEAIVKQMHGLHADPGGAAGIGLPGGPRDVVIVGAGPGGLAASINGAAEGLDTLVIEANAVAGGQAKYSSRIENFPGFPIGVTGERLTQNMFTQAGRLGAETKLGIRVEGMTYDPDTGLKHLTLSNGEQIDSRTVILAGGVEFRKLDFPGSDGAGVVVGDGKALVKEAAGGPVVVVGGSNGAAQAALGCAQKSDRVYLLARSPIGLSMSDYQVTALRNNPKITVIESDSIAKANRDEQGNLVSVETAKGERLHVTAVGAFVGSMPNTKWLPASIPLAGGKIATNADYETPVPGVYAVGDMRNGGAGRVGVAVGEGQFALRQANAFLDAQRRTTDAVRDAYTPNTSNWITHLFALDRDNPWFGQTIEDVTPPKKKTA